MQKELYFDVVSEEGAGALHRIADKDGNLHFYYHYTSTDLETDLTVKTESKYRQFHDFWEHFISDRLWFCLHPLYIHPEQRSFVKAQLEKVDWLVVQDEKWREMYQKQWNKVLNNPAEYYKPR